MNNIYVSVIFPVYNNEKYVERCIRSVMCQTLREIEMIVIDDGSIDNAPSLIDKLAKEDNRIRVIHKENEGSAKARNIGLNLARGEYIAFVESDDYTVSDMYERLFDRATITDADIVKCGFYYKRLDNARESKIFYGIAREEETFKACDHPFIFSCHASIWAGIYKRKFIEENSIRFIETPRATYSDFSWMTNTYACAKKITIYHRAFYYYTYDNPESSHFKYGKNYQYKIFHAIESLRMLDEVNIYDDVKDYFNNTAFGNCIDAARMVVPDNRRDCFDRLYDLCNAMIRKGFDYSELENRRSCLFEFVINREFDKFYELLLTEYTLWDYEFLDGKRIVLFGAGVCGKSYFVQLKKWRAVLVKWIDNNPDYSMNIEPVENVVGIDYDLVLLSVIDKSVSEQMKNQLLTLGVDEEKIVWRLPFRLV